MTKPIQVTKTTLQEAPICQCYPFVMVQDEEGYLAKVDNEGDAFTNLGRAFVLAMNAILPAPALVAESVARGVQEALRLYEIGSGDNLASDPAALDKEVELYRKATERFLQATEKYT
jgi:hypothetical protein